MSQLRAKDSTFFILGKVIGHSKPELTRQLEALGARVSMSLNASLDAVIVGANPSYKKHDRARALGLPCLDGDQLALLLEHGELDLSAQGSGRDVGELLEELRGYAYREPSREAWVGLTETLDEFAPADLPLGLDYVRGLVGRWEPGPRWEEAGGQWCIAPPQWLTALLAGDQSPKYSLVRAISFSAVGVKTKQAAALFDSDQLPGLRAFDIGYSNSTNILGPAFFKAMAQATTLQEVDTLVLRPGKGMAPALSRATSLPALKHLHLRTTQAGELIHGPWAAQLETLELQDLDSARVLESHGEALTSLDTLMVHVGGSMGYGDIDQEVGQWVQALQQARVWDRVRHLHLSAANAQWLGVLCQRLGEALDLKLEALHLGVLWGLTLTGDSGRNYLKELLSTGLAGQTRALCLGEGVDPSIVDVVRDLGVEVQLPAAAQPAQPEEAAAPGPMELADGEDARRQAGTFHWSDALLGESPSRESWEVVTAVADALALQGDSQGLQELAAAIAGWPEELRACPRRWFGLFLRAERDPRLDLVRLLSLSLFDFGQLAKGAELWFQELSTSAHLDVIHTVHLHFFGPQKGFLQALTHFYQAARPTCTRVIGKKAKDNEAIVAHLRQEGVLGIHLEGYPDWTAPVEYGDASGLDSAHVHLKVDSPEAMQAILDRTDLDHVVSLHLDYHEGNMSGPDFQAKAAHWSKLRHLCVTSHYYNPEGRPSQLPQALGTWLSQARPAVVACRDDELNLRLVQEGAYGRALGSELKLPSGLTWEALRGWLGQDKLRVGRLCIGYGAKLELTHLAPLVEMLSPRQREALLGLQWTIALEELEQLEALVGALPRLTTLHLENSALEEERPRLLAALAAAPSTRRLGVLVPVLWSSNYKLKVKALSKSDLKVLDQGKGLRAASYWLTGPSSTPSL